MRHGARAKARRPAAAPAAAAAVSELDAAFAALGDPTRRGVVALLRQGPRRAGELATALSMQPPAMSRHLRVLQRSGLIEQELQPDDARVRVFRLRRAPFGALRAWLDEVEAFWTTQLDAFQRHVEAQAATVSKARTRRKRGG